ncbi:type 1 fimbriae regulatory protein FimB [Tenacibaculum sp. MAR_2009_124]|uniref:tyrosine-type recombinase/integrase n=1 Tax=Tenacibaculum sp. MAR_2009_124 TaxID=1250059 RepID=UPI00089B31C8|nr:tyrosine-type recombinase/integrase [Tenacibaculum sp. MAR_2009_124]SEC65905.1 type 1 fimbriae regulatory protein FimB [Tenacibaculum sp. MAR_2009_124]
MNPNRRNVKSFSEDAVDIKTRSKNYLTLKEVRLILKAAKKTRYPDRNYLIILMMFRHGLRVTEATNLLIKEINFDTSHIWIERLKKGQSVTHRIDGDELRAIRRYLRSRNDNLPWLFINERGNQLTRHAVYQMIKSVAKKASIENVHPHTLRHSCGFYLANEGHGIRVIQDYLGHRDIKHTVIYTRITGRQFENIKWK